MELQSFLNQLDSQESLESFTSVYVGRAISRTSDSIHLAIDTGVVSIPINSVKEVTAINEDDPQIVRLEVSPTENVRQLIDLPSPSRILPGAVLSNSPNDFQRGIVFSPFETFTTPSLDDSTDEESVCVCGDSATISGGRLDSTDDFVVVVACW